MGHALTDYVGKCRHFHGHNYVLEVSVEGAPYPEDGMVIDFGDLKDAIKTVIDRDFDHRFLLCIKDPRWPNLAVLDDKARGVTFQPTAEMLAIDIKVRLQAEFLRQDITLPITRLVLWETEDSCAVIEDRTHSGEETADATSASPAA